MTNQKVKSYAKLNLGLKILNKRPDNYHNLNSIFVQINLYDTLAFIPSDKFSIECNDATVPTDTTNTIYKAFNLLNKNALKASVSI